MAPWPLMQHCLLSYARDCASKLKVHTNNTLHTNITEQFQVCDNEGVTWSLPLALIGQEISRRLMKSWEQSLRKFGRGQAWSCWTRSFHPSEVRLHTTNYTLEPTHYTLHFTTLCECRWRGDSREVLCHGPDPGAFQEIYKAAGRILRLQNDQE